MPDTAWYDYSSAWRAMPGSQQAKLRRGEKPAQKLGKMLSRLQVALLTSLIGVARGTESRIGTETPTSMAAFVRHHGALTRVHSEPAFQVC
eukprot:SAG31_NODE_1933_length_6879_cov_3.230973_4_plen_91_part_00